LPLLAKLSRVTVDGKPVQFHLTTENAAPICSFTATLRAKTVIEVAYINDVELDVWRSPDCAQGAGHRCHCEQQTGRESRRIEWAKLPIAMARERGVD
jgi:hypothetical protein